MTIASASDGTRALSIEDLKVSTTAAQAERRKHFNKAELEELAESIKTVGVLSPILARPANGHFEIVFGERRFIAAKLAGLTAINVSVRTLTDEQVLEVQLIENLQREGLHELAEAEGYEALQKFGHAAEEIADKVGKSKGYVYGRMKLLALSKAARTAFYDGKLTASTALLLARIPVESVQLEALKEITAKRYGLDAGMSFREAAELVRRDYMTNLSDAGFPTEDVTLVAAAGPCGACPKRTGNQAELFDDVKNENVCTDPVCFKAKREAHAARAIAKAKETGQMVITGKAAEKIAPYGAANSSLHGGHAKLTDRCYEDKKQRTYGQLLGKDFEPTLLQDPKTGVLVKIVHPEDIKAALKEAGVKPSSSSSGSGTQSAAEKKAKLEKKFRAALYSEMRDKFPRELGSEDLRTIALRFFEEMQQETQKQVLGLWQWEPAKNKGYGRDYRKPVADGLAGLADAQLVRFLFDLVFVGDLQVHTWSDSKPTLLLSTAKKLKVDAEKIRKQLNAASIPKAPKKTANKKSTTKGK
jgi:ParB/RepB/Spo0J family partition protein